jgi:hypothetical protein
MSSWYFWIKRKTPITDSPRSSIKWKVTMLSILLIVALTLLPHLPSVNPYFQAVSVDTEAYGETLFKADTLGIAGTIAEKPGKPVYFLLIYGAWIGLGRRTILLLDVIHPIMVLTGLAVLSSHISENRYGNSYSSLLVPLGYSLTGFLGGGYQANSLAQIPCILSLYIESGTKLRLIKVTLLLTLTGLLHSWTYWMYGAGFFLRELLQRRDLKKPLISLVLSYLMVSFVDLLFDLKLEMTGSTAAPLVNNFGFYLFENWVRGLNFWVWNTISNPLYVVGGLAGLDSVSVSLLSASAPLMLLMPANIIYRIVMNFPLQIPSSRGINRLSPRIRWLVFLILLVRVLGNITGLTPYKSVT